MNWITYTKNVHDNTLKFKNYFRNIYKGSF